MEQKIILLAETGSDITPKLAEEYGIYLVPMHVSMGGQTLDEGSFPAENVCAYYDKTGKVPTTSASMPDDFTRALDSIHACWPDKHILHLAYSAATTCSYHNAMLAAEDRDYVTHLDTQHVSIGQAAVVLEAAKLLRAHPEMEVSEAVEAITAIIKKVQMCFVPRNLDYLRAGGRVSNAVAMTGNLLNLHPCIEIIGGKLLAKKKYRGSLVRIIPKLIEDFVEKHQLQKDLVYFIQSPGLEDGCLQAAEAAGAAHGFRQMVWMKTGCVITCHGGPGCFGIVGFAGQ